MVIVMRLLFFCLILTSLSCGSCVFSKASKTPEEKPLGVRNTANGDNGLEAFISSATVQKNWQRSLIEKFSTLGAKEAWILVSYSGYSNRGQFAVYDLGSDYAFYYAAPNENTELKLIDTPKSKLDKFEEDIDAYEELSDYRRTSFDGMSYEFVHLDIEEGSLVTKRLFMNSLGLAKDQDEQHRELVATFAALIK
jgi:hypothetical protein